MPPLAQTIKAPSPPRQEVVHPAPPVPPAESTTQRTVSPLPENKVIENGANNHPPPPAPVEEPVQPAPVSALPAECYNGPIAVCLYNYTAGKFCMR